MPRHAGAGADRAGAAEVDSRFLGGNMNSAANWNGVFGTVFALMQFFFRQSSACCRTDTDGDR